MKQITEIRDRYCEICGTLLGIMSEQAAQALGFMCDDCFDKLQPDTDPSEDYQKF